MGKGGWWKQEIVSKDPDKKKEKSQQIKFSINIMYLHKPCCEPVWTVTLTSVDDQIVSHNNNNEKQIIFLLLQTFLHRGWEEGTCMQQILSFQFCSYQPTYYQTPA